MKKIYVTFLALLGLAAASVCSYGASEFQLTADNMDYDLDYERMDVSGNVTLSYEDLIVNATKGEFDNRAKLARLWPSVAGKGSYNNEKIDFKCNEIRVAFDGAFPVYSILGNVDITLGSRRMQASSVVLSDREFNVDNLKEMNDSKLRVAVSCKILNGFIDDDGLAEFTAAGGFHLKAHSDANVLTELWGERVVYSKEKGSLVVSGKARAKQKGRSFNGETLTYYPHSGVIEAKGRPSITVGIGK